jgi:hypothetical protein
MSNKSTDNGFKKSGVGARADHADVLPAAGEYLRNQRLLLLSASSILND